jgi:hypothetical protein
MRNNFAVFILTHGRPNRVLTLDTLKKCNYTGKWYLVIDNEDNKANEYYEKYGKDKVLMFDKLAISKTFDTCDTFDDRRTIVYARNVCFKLAKELGIDYFLELDDDYTEFRFRVEKDGMLRTIYCRHIDEVFEAMLDFLDIPSISTVALAQTGDFIGGTESNVFKQKLCRKAMNSFFCKTNKPFTFIGRINEDVNTYVNLGTKGELLFTVAECSLDQLATQSNKGGMTDVYLDSGTYVKSIYSVITNPSCVKIGLMGQSNKRIHHKILWNYCLPKIISEKYKK